MCQQCQRYKEMAEQNERLFHSALERLGATEVHRDRLLEALKNIENDAGQIPDHAWELIQDAIAKSEGTYAHPHDEGEMA